MRRATRDALRDYERWLRTTAAERTRETYLPVVRAFLDGLDVSVSRLERGHVVAFLAGYRELSRASQRRALYALASFCRHVDRAEASQGLAVRRVQGERRVLTRAEVAQLLRACMGGQRVASAVRLRDRALVETLYALGLRRSEACRARVADLDLQRGELLVRRAKRGQPAWLPFPPSALEAVATYLREARPKLVRRDRGELFVNRLGRGIDPNALSASVARLGRRVGLEVSPHDLRRACASHLVAAGVDVRTVQVLLGHRSLRVTAGYVGVERGALREAVEALAPQPQAAGRRG